MKENKRNSGKNRAMICFYFTKQDRKKRKAPLIPTLYKAGQKQPESNEDQRELNALRLASKKRKTF